MTLVRTRDEAIQALEGALGSWAEKCRGLWSQATARIAGVQSEIDVELRLRASRVAALEVAVASAPDDERAALLAQLDRARRAHTRAQRAAGEAAAAQDALQTAIRRSSTTLEAVIPAARADLRRRLGSLGAYRAGPSNASQGSTTAASVPGASIYESRGVEEIGVNDVDFTDNPIIDEFGKGGASRSDYRWATETWDSVVGPGVVRGMTRDDFARRDGERGAPPFRRTADVYDLFLGDAGQIVVSRTPNGRLDVINGRHRIVIARQLGINRLPARVIG